MFASTDEATTEPAFGTTPDVNAGLAPILARVVGVGPKVTLRLELDVTGLPYGPTRDQGR